MTAVTTSKPANVQPATGGVEEDEGLEFYDPIQAQKMAKAEALREREQEQPTMVKINGKLISAASLNQNDAKNVKARNAMIQDLKAKSMVKKQGTIDLQQIKSTFQTTDLASK